MHSTAQQILSAHTTGKRSARRSNGLAQFAAPAVTPVPVRFNPLPLARLDASIPSQVLYQPNETEAARILYTFLDAKLITEDDITPHWTYDSIIESVLNRWILPYADKLSIFNVKLLASDNLDDFVINYGDSDVNATEVKSRCGLDETEDVISFGVVCPDCNEIFIGKKVAELEENYPGLGVTLLRSLFAALWLTVECQTPDTALDNCRYVHWMGEEDESLCLEEMMEEGCNADEIDIFRRADFFAHIPEWAVYEGMKDATIWDAAQLEVLAQSGQGESARIAAAILPLLDVSESPYQTSRLGFDVNIAPALLVRWSDTDCIYDVFDDMYRYASEGDSGGEIHRIFLAKNEPQSLLDCMDSMMLMIDRIVNIETLLKLIMEG